MASTVSLAEGSETAFTSRVSARENSRERFSNPERRIQDIKMLFLDDLMESQRFQMTIGLAIVANAFVLAGEVDHPNWLGWIFFDNFFLLLFMFELVGRILHNGLWGFFSRSNMVWAVLDTVTVGLGVFDTWLAPLCKAFGVIVSSNGTSGLRALRMLRLLRMIRVIRMFPKIQNFMVALVSMFGSMVWIFLVLAMFMVSCAIIMRTHLGEDVDGTFADVLAAEGSQGDEGARKLSHISFRNVPTSLFTLFVVITQDNWRKVADPVIEFNPAMQMLFVVFIIIGSWTMISILTAVASDSMVEATADRKDEEAREAMVRAQAFISFLQESFKAADADGSGTLDKYEFEGMVNQDYVVAEMHRLGFSMSTEELMKLWDILDVEMSGELGIDDFVNGLTSVQENLSTRHVVGLGFAMQRVSIRIEKDLDAVVDQIEYIRRNQEVLLQALYRQEALNEEQRLSLKLWQAWLQKNDPSSLARLNV